MDDAERYLDEEVPAILGLVLGSDVRELEMSSADRRIRVHRRGTQTVVLESMDEQVTVEPPVFPITAPIVGTFYQAPRPGMSPLVSEGTRVDEGTVVGIIEALQVLTEVEAGRRGVIRSIYAIDGQPVEYGQVLFEVETLG